MSAADERVLAVGRKFRFSILEEAGVPSGTPLEFTAAVSPSGTVQHKSLRRKCRDQHLLADAIHEAPEPAALR